MKINLPVTNKRKRFAQNERIISLTDKKGAITYANDAFTNISGFDISECLHKNHNLVRHPDMPPAAFQNLWDYLKAGKPWMGLVKNRCKNGDYYWVNAYVAPVFENGTVTGYQSVRMVPDEEHVDRAGKLYKKLMDRKRLNWLPFVPGVALKTFLGMLLLLASAVVAMSLITNTAVADAATLAAGSAFAFALSRWLTAPVRRMAERAREIYDNPVMRHVYAGSADEHAQISLAMSAQDAKLRTITGRIEDSIEQLTELATTTQSASKKTSEGVNRQEIETEQLATAINEMAATVQEVARNTDDAARAAQEAGTETQAGTVVVQQTIHAINQLANEIETSADVIHQLETDSEEIGTVLDVIKGIADQTNLLALNAAIEAARAGEQGRGFAVVADEVRNLAMRTQDSTRQIQDMIERLQKGAQSAVKAMEQGREQAKHSVQQAAHADESLSKISAAVDTISNMNHQIAAAAEEQSAVAEEINRNIVNITQIAHATAMIAEETATNSDKLSEMSGVFDSVVRQSKL
jgi:aerotaxis receptor